MATANARIVSVAALLLACAPLGSLYAVLLRTNSVTASYLFFSPTWLPHATQEAPAPSDNTGPRGVPVSKSMSSLHAILQDPNSTLEELWVALFRESQASNIMFASLPTMQEHHWTIVLPWCISLILGVIVPFMLSIVNYLRPDDAHDDDNDDDDSWVSQCNRRRDQKRLKKLVRRIRDYRKVRKHGEGGMPC